MAGDGVRPPGSAGAAPAAWVSGSRRWVLRIVLLGPAGLGAGRGGGVLVCKTTPNPLSLKPHQIPKFAERVSRFRMLGQIVHLGVPRSSRGGSTKALSDTERRYYGRFRPAIFVSG